MDKENPTRTDALVLAIQRAVIEQIEYDALSDDRKSHYDSLDDAWCAVAKELDAYRQDILHESSDRGPTVYGVHNP